MVRRRKRKSWSAAVIALAVVIGLALVLVLARREQPAVPSLPLPPECKLGPTVAGVDVSYYQGAITWSRVRKAGVRFAFIRAYDGTDTFDTRFYANWTGAAMAGVWRAAYQYFRPELSPVDQADALVRALRTYGAGELPPVLDVETTSGLSLDAVAAGARVWIDRVRSELGVEPFVYTNVGMWRARPATELGTQPLWLAHYTTVCPSVPLPWVRWTFWQYTDGGRVPGIGQPVDLDVFDGTLEDLRRHVAAPVSPAGR